MVEVKTSSWHYKLMRKMVGPKELQVCPSCGSDIKPSELITKCQLVEPKSVCGYAVSVMSSIAKLLIVAAGWSVAFLLLGVIAYTVLRYPSEFFLMASLLVSAARDQFAQKPFMSTVTVCMFAVLLMWLVWARFTHVSLGRRLLGWFYEYLHALKQHVCIPVKYVDES